MTSHTPTSTAAPGLLNRDLVNAPVEIAGGRGVWLYGQDGRRYLDAVGGAAVVTIGHGVEEIYRELDRVSPVYVYGEGFVSPSTRQFAEELLDLVAGPYTSAYFVSGGSEANETAVKLARQHHIERGEPTRHKVIARWQSYHGVTTGTLSLSGRTTWRAPFDPYLFEVPRIPAPYCYRCPFGLTYPDCGVWCASELERAILREGPETVAAFIAEPVIGTTATAVTPVAEYYQRIREICDRYGVLFIADEVLTGMGRTGRPLAIDHWGVDPDLVTLGKGIGSGYTALGAVLATEKVIAPLRAGSGRFNHGFTYAGLPAASVVGLQVLDYLRRHHLIEACDRAGHLIRERLHSAAATVPALGDIRGLGLLIGVELVEDPATRTPYPAEYEFAAKVARRCLQEHSVLIRAGLPGINHGSGGDHLQLSPPFTITDEEIGLLVNAVIESVQHVERAYREGR